MKRKRKLLFVVVFVLYKSTHNRRERPIHGHRGGSRGRFYYRITTFEERPWDARDPHKTTFMTLKHAIRLSIWQRQKETPGVEKAPGVSSPQRKESGRSGRDDGELRFWVRPGHPYKAVRSRSPESTPCASAPPSLGAPRPSCALRARAPRPSRIHMGWARCLSAQASRRSASSLSVSRTFRR